MSETEQCPDPEQCLIDTKKAMANIIGKVGALINKDVGEIQQALNAVCGPISNAKARDLATSIAKSTGGTVRNLGEREAFNKGCSWKNIIQNCGSLGLFLFHDLVNLIMGSAVGAGLTICTQINNMTISDGCSLNLDGCGEAVKSIAGLAAPATCVKELYDADTNLELVDNKYTLKTDAQKSLCVLCSGVNVQKKIPLRDTDQPAPVCGGSETYLFTCGAHELGEVTITWTNIQEKQDQIKTVAEKLVSLYKSEAKKGVGVLKSLIQTSLGNKAKFRSNVISSLTGIDNPTGDVSRILLLRYLNECSNLNCNGLIEALTPNDDCIDKILGSSGNVPRNDWPTGTKSIPLDTATNLGFDLDNIDNPNNKNIATNLIHASIGDDGKKTKFTVQCEGAEITKIELVGNTIKITYQFPPSAGWSSGITNVGDCQIKDFREKMKRMVDALNASRTPCGGHSPMWPIVLGYTDNAPLQPIGFGPTIDNPAACLYKWPNEVNNEQRTGVGGKDAAPNNCLVYPAVYDRTKRETFVLDLFILIKILGEILPNKSVKLDKLFNDALSLIDSLQECG